MPNIVKNDVDALNASLTLTITPDDYQKKLKAELSHYLKNAQIKGFRKGKASPELIKKMYGKSILADIINKEVDSSIRNYIVDNKLQLFGQPVPSEDHQLVGFDLNKNQDYVFKFDIGVQPEFEIKGIKDGSTYTYYKTAIPANWIDEDFSAMRKRNGERKDVETEIYPKDFLELTVKELENGAVKEGGVEKTFSALVEFMQDDLKERVMKLKKGDTFELNIRQLEKDMTYDRLRKYILAVEDSVEFNDDFTATIDKVTRVEEADLTQEFYDKSFGVGKVTNEEEAKAEIAKMINDAYDNQSDALLYRDIQEKMLNDSEIPLPETFLKRWLKVSDEKNTDEAVESGFPNFARSLKWSLIKNKLEEQYEVLVLREDVINEIKNKLNGMYGNSFPADLLENLANSMLSNPKDYKDLIRESEDNVIYNKLFGAVRKDVNINEVSITPEELNEKMRAASAKVQEEQGEESDEVEFETVETN